MTNNQKLIWAAAYASKMTDLERQNIEHPEHWLRSSEFPRIAADFASYSLRGLIDLSRDDFSDKDIFDEEVSVMRK